MPSILIHGGDPKSREEKARGILQNHYLHFLEEDGEILPLPRIREILPHLHLVPPAPFGGRGVLILEAQRLSFEIQNTLLKTLEEPPAFLTFVLTVANPRLLLPTVVSRCLVEAINDQKLMVNGEEKEVAKKILTTEGGQRLAFFEDKVGYDKQAVNNFLDAVEITLSEDRSNNFTQILPRIWQTKKLLQDPSANLKLTVDQLLFSW